LSWRAQRSNRTQTARLNSIAEQVRLLRCARQGKRFLAEEQKILPTLPPQTAPTMFTARYFFGYFYFTPPA